MGLTTVITLILAKHRNNLIKLTLPKLMYQMTLNCFLFIQVTRNYVK